MTVPLAGGHLKWCMGTVPAIKHLWCHVCVWVYAIVSTFMHGLWLQHEYMLLVAVWFRGSTVTLLGCWRTVSRARGPSPSTCIVSAPHTLNCILPWLLFVVCSPSLRTRSTRRLRSGQKSACASLQGSLLPSESNRALSSDWGFRSSTQLRLRSTTCARSSNRIGTCPGYKRCWSRLRHPTGCPLRHGGRRFKIRRSPINGPWLVFLLTHYLPMLQQNGGWRPLRLRLRLPVCSRAFKPLLLLLHLFPYPKLQRKLWRPSPRLSSHVRLLDGPHVVNRGLPRCKMTVLAGLLWLDGSFR